MKKIVGGMLLAASAFCNAQQVHENQYYTSAEVFESAPLYGKKSIDCVTCPDVLLGYKIGLRVIQKTQYGEKTIIFDTVTKQPVRPGTWVKVGMRVDLVVPVKTFQE